MLKVRTGHESVNQSQPCWALPHQAKGSNTEIRSCAHEQDVSTLTGTKKGYKSGNTNEDTATVASPLGHGPSASNRAMTISITSDLPTTWISGISCTISRSCTVTISHTVPCHARWWSLAIRGLVGMSCGSQTLILRVGRCIIRKSVFFLQVWVVFDGWRKHQGLARIRTSWLPKPATLAQAHLSSQNFQHTTRQQKSA